MEYKDEFVEETAVASLVPNYVWYSLFAVWFFFIISFIIGFMPFMIFMTVMGTFRLIKLSIAVWMFK